MILCIGPTPAEQRVMIFRRLMLNEVNRATTTLDGPAGKSTNVAKALAALGERPVATGFLGGTRGDRLRSALEARGIGCDFSEAGQTRQCVTVIDELNGTQTELVEESQPLALADYDRLEAIVGNRIKECRAVIMSGTLTPGGPVDFYLRCTQIANSAGALSVVDAHGAPLLEAIRARPGVVKPNRLELASTLGKELDTEGLVISAMRELHERGAQRVIVTAGTQPSLAFDGRAFWRISPPRVIPVNPIGSGDTFTAALVWRLLLGEDLGQASRWGTAAGAANALTILAGEISAAEVERLAKEVVVEQIGKFD